MQNPGFSAMKKNFLTLVFSLLLISVTYHYGFGFSLSAEYLCNIGIDFYNAGRYEQALYEFNKVLMFEPNNETAKTYVNYIFARDEHSSVITFEKQEDREFSKKGDRGKLAVNTQVSAFTGDFGDLSGKSTTTGYFTETIKYIDSNLGEIGVSIPYVYRNGGGVTAGENVVATTVHTIPKHADGIGDVLLKGRYYLIDEGDYLPAVDLTAKVKFPTASHDRGLGTGEFDFGVGTSLLKCYGDFIGLLDMGIVVRERPNGSTLKPFRVDYSLGIGYSFTSKIAGYFFIEGSSKTTRTQRAKDAPLELVAAGTYKYKKDLSFNGYGLMGLTNGSPEFGASAGVTKYF